MDKLSEQLAIELVGKLVWDSLPDIVKKQMIESKKKEIELEKREMESIREREETEKRLKEIQADFAVQSQMLLEKEQELADKFTKASLQEELMVKEKEKFEIFKSDYEHYIKHALTVDETTPTLEELGTTRSRDVIATSREYIGPVREDHDKLKTGEISFEEAQRKKEELLKQLIKDQDARRQRERRASGKIIKKQVERDVSKMATKATDSISMSIDEFKNTVPIVYKDVVLIVPTQQELERVLSEQAQRCLDEAASLATGRGPVDNRGLIHGNSFTMQIVGEGVFHSYLPARCIVNSDGTFHNDWWTWFVNEIEQRVARVVDTDNYEVKDKQLQVVSLGMYYYLQRIESIDNWFVDREVNQIMKFKDFEMFTANDLSTNCQRQVVEHFGELWDPSKVLDDMLAPRKVIRGHPGHKRMDQIDSYSDLVWDYHEDVVTTDCTNIARIVEYNGHVGVITLIKRQSAVPKIMKRLPYKSSTNNAVSIFVDIEAFESPQPGKYKLQVPYLICWTWPRELASESADDATSAYEVVYETGPGCVEKFVIRLLESYEDCELCLYAWYGSGYDYQHIYKYLKDRCEDDTTYVRNNAIIYAKFKMGNKLTIHLKDPFLFILCSLDKAAKAFGVLNKGTFPHEVIKNWGDLDKVIDEWYIVRRSTSESIDEEGKTILVTANNWNEIIERNNTSSVLQKAIEYCSIDVLAMQQIWTKFCSLMEQHLSVKITSNIFTLSQLSMKIMMATLPPKINLHVPDRKEYDFMHNAIYGGRVVAKNGVYEEAILYADVVSLYPSAMKLLDHPHGKMKLVNLINWNKIGIYEVVLTSDKKPDNYMEFVPFRDQKGGLSYNWRKKWQGTYHTYDLLIAKQEGYNIKCIRGMEWSKAKLFNTFVDKLFKMKANNEGPIRMVAKIALNGGGYGKFVQKPIDTDLYVVRKGVVHGAFERMEKNSEGMVVKARHVINMPKFYPLDDTWDKMVIEDPEALPQYPTQVGISILSGSRYRLYTLCKDFQHRHTADCPLPCTEKGMEVIYSDTDSIFVTQSSINVNKFRASCGKELGQLDDTIDNTPHGTINRMYIAGPKMYAYEYHDQYGMPQQVVHCKGVRNQDLKMSHFEWLCKDVDYRIKYNMIVMAKNIVSVRTMNIAKQIAQT